MKLLDSVVAKINKGDLKYLGYCPSSDPCQFFHLVA